MENELRRFRNEVKADFELTWGRISDQGKRLDGRIDRLEDSFQSLETGFGGMESAMTTVSHSLSQVQTDLSHLQTATAGAHAALIVVRQDVRELGSSLRDTYRLYQGRLRQMEERFDTFLGLVDEEKASRSDLEALEARVQALEERQPPAA